MNLGITPINFFQFALGSHPCWITMYFGSILLWLKKLFLFCFVVNFGGGRVLTNLLEASIEQAGYTTRKKVLTDVFLEVRKGELVGLIGANGAGKSTAIKRYSAFQKILKGILLERLFICIYSGASVLLRRTDAVGAFGSDQHTPRH